MVNTYDIGIPWAFRSDPSGNEAGYFLINFRREDVIRFHQKFRWQWNYSRIFKWFLWRIMPSLIFGSEFFKISDDSGIRFCTAQILETFVVCSQINRVSFSMIRGYPIHIEFFTIYHASFFRWNLTLNVDMVKIKAMIQLLILFHNQNDDWTCETSSESKQWCMPVPLFLNFLFFPAEDYHAPSYQHNYFTVFLTKFWRFSIKLCVDVLRFTGNSV